MAEHNSGAPIKHKITQKQQHRPQFAGSLRSRQPLLEWADAPIGKTQSYSYLLVPDNENTSRGLGQDIPNDLR